MRRLDTPDWRFVGWHYRALHALGTPWHNRLWLRATGLEHLPREGGFVFVGNHTSWWDPIALASCVGRPVCWLAKKELFRGPATTWFFGRGGAIPVDRNGRNPRAYAAAAEALRDGRVVGVCPEGTRRVGPPLGPFKTGAARLAMEAKAPVVPAGVLSDRFWPPGEALPTLTEKIWVNVGEPLWLEGDPSDPAQARAQTERVAEAVARLLDEARRAREKGAHWPAP